MKTLVISALLTCSLFLVAGCGKEADNTAPVTTAPPEGKPPTPPVVLPPPPPKEIPKEETYYVLMSCDSMDLGAPCLGGITAGASLRFERKESKYQLVLSGIPGTLDPRLSKAQLSTDRLDFYETATLQKPAHHGGDRDTETWGYHIAIDLKNRTIGVWATERFFLVNNNFVGPGFSTDNWHTYNFRSQLGSLKNTGFF